MSWTHQLGNDAAVGGPASVSLLVGWSLSFVGDHTAVGGSSSVSLVGDWGFVGDDTAVGGPSSVSLLADADWGRLLNHCSGLGLGWFGWVG
jgi:hypothetical protein